MCHTFILFYSSCVRATSSSAMQVFYMVRFFFLRCLNGRSFSAFSFFSFLAAHVLLAPGCNFVSTLFFPRHLKKKKLGETSKKDGKGFYLTRLGAVWSVREGFTHAEVWRGRHTKTSFW